LGQDAQDQRVGYLPAESASKEPEAIKSRMRKMQRDVFESMEGCMPLKGAGGAAAPRRDTLQYDAERTALHKEALCACCMNPSMLEAVLDWVIMEHPRRLLRAIEKNEKNDDCTESILMLEAYFATYVVGAITEFWSLPGRCLSICLLLGISMAKYQLLINIQSKVYDPCEMRWDPFKLYEGLTPDKDVYLQQFKSKNLVKEESAAIPASFGFSVDETADRPGIMLEMRPTLEALVTGCWRNAKNLRTVLTVIDGVVKVCLHLGVALFAFYLNPKYSLKT